MTSGPDCMPRTGKGLWAVRHPGQFAKAVGGDLVAAEDHGKGEHAHGGGRNAVTLLSLLAPAGWAAATARVVERVAMADAQVLKRISEAADTAALAVARANRAKWLATRAEGEARLAESRIEAATQKAEQAAECTREKLGEVPAETLKKAGEAGRDATATVIDGYREEPVGTGPRP